MIGAWRAAVCAGALVLAGAAPAWAYGPEAPGSKELEFDLDLEDLTDLTTPRSDALDTTIWTRLEWLYVFRHTGQLRNYNQHEGDAIALTKDLGADQGQFRPLIEVGVSTHFGAFPFSIVTSVFEWDTEGAAVLERGHFYGATVVPRGDYARTRAWFLRTTLDANLGVWGYDHDEYSWKLDVAAGVHVLAALWDVNLDSQADLEGVAGDPRVFAGVEAHKKLADWFTIHMRGVLGNPSTILGGYRFAADVQLGDVKVRAEALFGTPTFGGWALLVDWALTRNLSVGFVWREWFDQIVDGGAFFGKTNEAFIRMHHSLVGLSAQYRF
ncbi:MAG: hypothetical protein ACYTGX_01560 [Planctomycetota bacterium]